MNSLPIIYRYKWQIRKKKKYGSQQPSTVKQCGYVWGYSLMPTNNLMIEKYIHHSGLPLKKILLFKCETKFGHMNWIYIACSTNFSLLIELNYLIDQTNVWLPLNSIKFWNANERWEKDKIIERKAEKNERIFNFFARRRCTWHFIHIIFIDHLHLTNTLWANPNRRPNRMSIEN